MKFFWTTTKEVFINLARATLPLAILAFILSIGEINILLAAGISIIFITIEIKIIMKWTLPWFSESFLKILSDSDNPGDEDAIIEAANQCYLSGDLSAAKALYEQYTQENPKFLRAWLLRASFLREKLEDYDAAIDVLKQALAQKRWMKSDKSMILFKIARIYEVQLKNQDKARAYYNEAATKCPNTAYGKEAAEQLQKGI
ncbi:MAG: tetratricopeptide repeat protein [Akkermansia sp.]